jgi:PilZ domain
MNAVEERRRHRRFAVRTNLRCRRLGRGGFDEEVASIDLSLGGVLLLADDRVDVGDVVALDFAVVDVTLGLRGLVVSVRPTVGSHGPHGPHGRYVHVAFTGLSPERLDSLCQFLDTLVPAATAD